MIYTIKKGKHRSNRFLPKLSFTNNISGTFNFITDVEESDFTNKIVGLSDNFHHHHDSVRIGFRKLKGELWVCGIFYVNGQRTIKNICKIEVNKDYQFSIEIGESYYKVSIGDVYIIHYRNSTWDFIRYHLFPYFGGTGKVSKEIKISLDYHGD